mmetsp:Transcript_55739/g.121372  ORF Transcript_55739/g.121372 Transcript_55739/m.121372 type:complete len:283 (+) Transcript_55739:2967-3815(+)
MMAPRGTLSVMSLSVDGIDASSSPEKSSAERALLPPFGWPFRHEPLGAPPLPPLPPPFLSILTAGHLNSQPTSSTAATPCGAAEREKYWPSNSSGSEGATRLLAVCVGLASASRSTTGRSGAERNLERRRWTTARSITRVIIIGITMIGKRSRLKSVSDVKALAAVSSLPNTVYSTKVEHVTSTGVAVNRNMISPDHSILPRICLSSISRLLSSSCSIGSSHEKSLRMRMPCSTSLVNLTRLSRFAMVAIVSLPVFRPMMILSGSMMIITPRPAKPETPSRL